MKKTDLDYIILDLQGAAGLTLALGDDTGHLADCSAAHRIVAETIYKAIENLQALANE